MSENKMELLFTYGTFRDLTIQKALFKRVVTMEPAVLEGHCVFCGEDGFFSIYEEENAITRGFVLELYPDEMWTADQWEEVPFYEREKRMLKTDSGQVEAWVYLKSSENKGIKVDNTEISADIAFEELAEEIQKFQLYQNTRTIPNGDFYMIMNCWITNGEKWIEHKKNGVRLKKTSNGHKKFINLGWAAMKQKNVVMSDGIIGGNYYFYLPSHNMQTRIPGVFYFFEDGKNVIIILVFPGLLIDIDYVMNAYEEDKLLIETKNWKQYLGELGLHCGSSIQKKYFVNGTPSQVDREFEKRLNDDVEWFYYKDQKCYDKRIKSQIEAILTQKGGNKKSNE